MLVLFAGLMAFHLGSLWVHQIDTEATLGTAREAQLAERLVSAKRVVQDLPRDRRDQTAHALSSASLDLHWTEVPTVRASPETSPRIEALRARLAELASELEVSHLRLGYAEEGADASPHLLLGALPLADGSWLNFSAALFRHAPPKHATFLSTTAMGVGILLLGLFVVRLIGRPLR